MIIKTMAYEKLRNYI